MNINTMKDNKITLATAPIEDCYGFFGTIKMNERIGEKEAIKAWEEAFEVLRSAPWQPTDTAIRNFLRSRRGRHFADATTFYEGSLESRIQQASGETWVEQEFADLKRQGFDAKRIGGEDVDCD